MSDHRDDHTTDGTAQEVVEMSDGSSRVTTWHADGRQVEVIFDELGRKDREDMFINGKRWKSYTYWPENGALFSERIFQPDGSSTCSYYYDDGTPIPPEEL